MFAVRYLALLALTVWLGGSLALSTAGATWATDAPRQLQLLAYVCGSVTLICLFVIKFVGPPPRAFKLRAAIVATMLAVAACAGLAAPAAPPPPRPDDPAPVFARLHTVSKASVAFNVAAGLVLLSWYARE